VSLTLVLISFFAVNPLPSSEDEEEEETDSPKRRRVDPVAKNPTEAHSTVSASPAGAAESPAVRSLQARITARLNEKAKKEDEEREKERQERHAQRVQIQEYLRAREEREAQRAKTREQRLFEQKEGDDQPELVPAAKGLAPAIRRPKEMQKEVPKEDAKEVVPKEGIKEVAKEKRGVLHEVNEVRETKGQEVSKEVREVAKEPIKGAKNAVAKPAVKPTVVVSSKREPLARAKPVGPKPLGREAKPTRLQGLTKARPVVEGKRLPSLQEKRNHMKAMSAKRQMVPEEIKPSPSKPTPSPSRKRKSTDDETVAALATPPPATKEAKTESDGEEKNQRIRENLKRNSVRRPATPLPPASKGVRNATPVPPKQCVFLSLITFRSKLTVLVLPQ